MRMTRRVRPSQVGCAATISRRRLYAANASQDVATLSSELNPRLMVIIDRDGQIMGNVVEIAPEHGVESRRYASEAELVSSNARGL